MSSLLSDSVALGKDLLPTPEEFRKGCKDVVVEHRGGGRETVRLTRLPPKLQRRAVEQSRGDVRKLLGPMLPPKSNSEEFFESLDVFSLACLEFAAAALCIGPGAAEKLLDLEALKHLEKGKN